MNLNITDIIKAKEQMWPLTGEVESATRDNSMIVRLGKELTGVIPFNELYEQKESIPHQRVGRKIKFLVKEIIHRPGKEPLIILSPKEYAIRLKEELFREYNQGNRVLVTGLVVNTTDKLAFIDIGGGLTGVLHISEVCRVRLKRIDEKVKRFAEVQVYIKSFDNRGRIQLSQKDVYPSPEESIKKLDLHVGKTLAGVIRGEDPNGNGVFVELMPNLIGLADFPKRFRVQYGDTVTVNVRRIEANGKEVSLDILEKLNSKPDESSPDPDPPFRNKVPDVSNMTYEEAVEELRKNECYIIVKEEEYCETVEKGRVTRTLPAKFSPISEYESVKVYVSKELEPEIVIPSVIGMNIAEAEKIFSDYEVIPNIKKEYNSEFEKNTVFDVSPQVGSVVRPGIISITLYVSKGPEKTEDSVPVSPFAVRKNERKVPDDKPKRNRLDLTLLQTMFHDGAISDVEMEILKAISNQKFITSKQIYELLNTKGIQITSQDKASRLLEKLRSYGLIARYHFESDEGVGIFRAYCMDLHGNIFLHRTKGIPYNGQYRHIDEKPHVIKRHLAANQVLIAYLLNRSLGTIADWKVGQKLSYQIGSRVFSIFSTLLFELVAGTEKYECNIEVVRRKESGWEVDYIDRMRRFQSYYETLDKVHGLVYRLVVVCEDDLHMIQAYELSESEGIYFKGVDLAYTHDLMHDSRDLSDFSNSLVRFNYMESRRNFILEL